MVGDIVQVPEFSSLTGDELEIFNLYVGIQSAMINKDVSFLSKVYTPGSTITHISGKVQGHDEFVIEIDKGILNYFNSELLDGYYIEVNGDVAVLKGVCILDAKVYGSKGVWSLEMCRYFVRVDDVWFAGDEIYN